LPPSFNLPDLLVALVIILPAIGASLAGIRVHREHLRNAERYDQIASHLLIISEQIGQVSDMKTFTSLLEEANETMLRENKDWRVVFLFQKLETP
jgi:membrane protein required for beta-lactamase induction